MSAILSEWGLEGARRLAATAKVLVVVDVLSFSTCVDVAVDAGAVIFPHSYGDLRSASAAAASLDAQVAGPRGDPSYRYSLSPASLAGIAAGTRIVLPSPNGSAIAAVAHDAHVIAGCLRNASAVARAAAALAEGEPVAVIPAGERWPDGSLRPAIEDLLGAGAIIAELDGDRSAEAEIACSAFLGARDGLCKLLQRSVSGQELAGRGYGCDVVIAGELNKSTAVPHLVNGAFMRA